MSQELDDDALVALPRRRQLDWATIGDGQHRRARQPLVSSQGLAGAQGRHEEMPVRMAALHSARTLLTPCASPRCAQHVQHACHGSKNLMLSSIASVLHAAAPAPRTGDGISSD